MRRLLAIALLLAPLAAHAQPVQQSGNVTAGHPAYWISPGIIADAGLPNLGYLTGLGVTFSGNGICQNSGFAPAAYNQLCLGVTGTTAALTYTAVGGTGNLTLYNGATKFQLPATAGSSGYVLQTDGAGITSWVAGGGGGGGTPGGASGQVQYNNSGAFGGFTLNGDCTLGVPSITCTKTNGVAFVASATTDTTVASNITSGTLPAGRLSGSYTGITGLGTVTAGATGAGFTVALGTSTVTGQLGLGNGGSNANLTASNGGVVYSTASALAILAGTGSSGQCLLSGSNTAPTWGSCTGSAAVSSVGNAAADSTLTIGGTGSGPWTGAVTAALNLSNANTWAAAQTFTNSDLLLLGSSTGATTFTSANASGTNYTITVPAITGTLATLNTAGTFTAATWNGAAITGTYIASNTVANANLAQAGANTWKGNSGGSTGNVGDRAWTSCSTATSAVTYTNGTGTTCRTDAASLTAADQTLSGGANVTANNIGTVTSGTTTIDCGTSPLQYLTNGGAFTLAAPSNDGSCVIQITNNGSAGAVTFSGFTVNASYTGGSLTTTNTNKFMVSVTRINGSSIYNVIPQQ